MTYVGYVAAARVATCGLGTSIFTVVVDRSAVRFTTGVVAQVRSALRHCEARAADQRHYDGDDAHNILHCSLLLLASSLRGRRPRRLKARWQSRQDNHGDEPVHSTEVEPHATFV